MTGDEALREGAAIRETMAPAVAEVTEALRGIVEALGNPAATGAADRIAEARGIVGASLAALRQDVEHAAELAARVKAAGLAREGADPALWRFHLARRLLRRVRVRSLGEASDPRLIDAVVSLQTTINSMAARVKGDRGQR